MQHLPPSNSSPPFRLMQLAIGTGCPVLGGPAELAASGQPRPREHPPLARCTSPAPPMLEALPVLWIRPLTSPAPPVLEALPVLWIRPLTSPAPPVLEALPVLWIRPLTSPALPVLEALPVLWICPWVSYKASALPALLFDSLFTSPTSIFHCACLAPPMKKSL